jgi:hypothetical protein
MSNLDKMIEAYGRGELPKPYLMANVFWTTDTSKFSKGKPHKEKPAPKKGDSAKGNHITQVTKGNAILHKNSIYRVNFSRYIRTDDSRLKVYNTISDNVNTLYGTDAPLIKSFLEDNFTLKAHTCNFNAESELSGKKAGNKLPYKWEAHHILPYQAFSTMKSEKGGDNPVFTPEQYEVLRSADYDINHGHNLIALPASGMSFFQPVHDLIQHPSDHPKYTKHVISEMQKVSKKLDDTVEKLGEDHPDMSEIVKLTFRAEDELEDELWDLLISIGKECVSSVVEKRSSKLEKEEAGLVKNEAKTTGTTYQYKALA